MPNTKELWKNALPEIENNLSKPNFSTWFKDAYVARNDGGTIYLSFPNQFVRDWVSDKYHTLLLRIFRNISEDIRAIEYTISKGQAVDETKKEAGRPVDQIGVLLPLQDFYVDKENNLNPRYDFENFVVGPFNELAHAAAQAVIGGLGLVYNPLFIYGRTGYGKTHLLQAVGNRVRKLYPTKKVYYITSEKFGQGLVTALQTNKINAFKERYRKYDVFIMDDIQFLSNKEKMQEELFHLFDTLYNNNKQIIFSSDQHPNYIPNLEERLRSRFNAGMTVDISAPDSESRVAILKSKTAALGFSISDSVIEYISSVVEGSVRELEGALNTIICHSQLKNKNLGVDEVKAILKNNLKPKRIIPIEDVVKIVSSFYNIDAESIYKKTRKKEVVRPRQLIMYILREDYGIAYPAIGQKLGGRDHTTVIHSYEKVKKDLEKDESLLQEINRLRSML